MSEKVSFVIELIDNVTSVSRKVTASIGAMGGAMGKTLGAIDGGIHNVAQSMNGWEQSKFFALAGNVENVARQFEALSAKTATYADALTDAQKTTSLTAQEVVVLSDNLKGFGTRTATTELLNMSRVAGEMGVRGVENVTAFTQAANLANVALGDQFGGAENTARALATINKLYKEFKGMHVDTALMKSGSVLNELNNLYGTNAAQLSDFVNRIGQLGDLAPKFEEAAAIGAVLQQAGITSEIGAGGLTKILTTAAKESKVFAKGLNMTDEAFRKMLETDPYSFIEKFAASMRGLSSTQQVAVLDKLKLGGDQETLKVVMTLAANYDGLAQKLKSSHGALQKGNSIKAEAALKENNLAASIERAKNKVTDYAASFGMLMGESLPAISQLGTVASGVVNLAPAFSVVSKSYMSVSGMAIGAIGKAKNFIETLKLISAKGIVTTIFGFLQLSHTIYNAITTTRQFMVVQLQSARTMAIGGARALLGIVSGLGGYIVALVNATAAQMGFNIALNANPLGLIVIGIAAVVGAVWLMVEYWDIFKNALVKFGLWLMETNPISGPIIWALSLVEKFFPGTLASIKGFFVQIWAWVTEWAEKAWGKIKWLWDKVKGALGLGETAKIEVSAKTGKGKNKDFADKPQPTDKNSKSIYDLLGAGKPTKNKQTEGLSSVTGGGSRPTNITINLGKFMDNLVIQGQTVGDALPETERKLKELLLRVLNSANQTATT